MSTDKIGGVDIDAGNEFARWIKQEIGRLWPSYAKEIGGFAGGGPIPGGVTRVVGSVDGVGTKIILSLLVDDFRFGWDAVAMAAVDVYVAGNMPAFAFDILKADHLEPERDMQILKSVMEGCKASGCILVGGETAELPDTFKRRSRVDLDVAVIGFPRPGMPPSPIAACQPVYGWLSGCPASNGFSSLREIFHLKDSPSKARKRLERYWPELGCTLAEALLKPTPIWIREIEGQRRRGVRFCGHAHITGGGMVDKIPRMLSDNCKVVIDKSRWKRPPIFRLAEERGGMIDADRVFNQGIMVASIVSLDGEELSHPNAVLIGQVERRNGDEPQVEFVGEYNDE